MGCCASAIRSDYGESLVHLPQKVAYLAKEAPDYYEVSGPLALLRIHGSSEHADSTDQHRNLGPSNPYARCIAELRLCTKAWARDVGGA